MNSKDTANPTTSDNNANLWYAAAYPYWAIQFTENCCKNILPKPLPANARPVALPLKLSSNQDIIITGIPIDDIVAAPTWAIPYPR